MTIHSYYREKMEEVVADRRRRLDAVRTREQALRYVSEVKGKISGCFSPFPDKTPLNAKITGTVEREGIRMEKVIFESRPGFPVTGVLYLPASPADALPAVLGLCGHSKNGKAEPNYQAFCQGLALKGFVVFIIDPISQGERVQYLDTERGQGVDWCCEEHNMLGKQLGLCGDFFGDWLVWDGIRALDYLLERPEVDPSRVGVTGNSGGGTMSTYLHLLDDRPKMTAISCFITSYWHNYNNELPADAEQIPPGILARGCDMADFLIARAPKPVMILGQKNDFFDPRGTREAYEEVRRIYALLGAEEAVRLFIGPDDHGYTQANRQAMYGFFAEHAAVEGGALEPKEVEPLPDAQVWCTKEGQAFRMPGTRKVVEFIQERAETLRAERVTPTAETLIPWLATRLDIPDVVAAPPLRTPKRRVIRDPDNPEILRMVSRFALATEPDVESRLLLIDRKAWYHIPEEKTGLLYVAHLDALDEIKDGLPELHAEGRIFGLDVRGIGEVRPTTCVNIKDYFTPYDTDYFYASTGTMLDSLYLGGKIRDVLAAVALLKESGYESLQLAGRGIGSLVVALAALFCPFVSLIRLLNAPVSYQHGMLAKGLTRWPLSHMVPGALEMFDLPDVYRILAERDFSIINPWDHMFCPLSPEQLAQEASACGLPGSLFAFASPERTGRPMEVVR